MAVLSPRARTRALALHGRGGYSQAMEDRKQLPQHVTRLQEKLGYVFRDEALLLLALTHSSWANEHNEPGGEAHNERLEFLGDAVLELNISAGLYLRYPGEREGSLTHLRSRMVSEAMLNILAQELDMGQCLLLGRGEDAQGGRQRPALLADAVEAVLGAVYLDGGHEAARVLVGRLYERHWPTLDSGRRGKDHKTLLQELTQARFKALPTYLPLPGEGPEHARVFRSQLELPDGRICLGEGNTQKGAEQCAAQRALEMYQKEK